MEKGGERGLRRSSTFVTSGDFSPKASNKAQRAIIDERHFDRRKAFLNAKGAFKVAKGMRDEGRKEREGRVRETHRPSRHARAAA